MKKYWQCINCGAILPKSNFAIQALKIGVPVVGGNTATCDTCKTVYDVADVLFGKYDFFVSDWKISKAIKNKERATFNSENLTWYYKGKPLIGPATIQTYIDERDGQKYNCMIIGKQIWMTENLRYKSSVGCWAYDNDNNNINKYGYLYDWETAKKVCPSGWHLPTSKEWTKLLNHLGGDSIAGGKMKALENWNNPNRGATNECYFSCLPGGVRESTGNYIEMGRFCALWTSTEDSQNNGLCKQLSYSGSEVTGLWFNKEAGLSVRCIMENKI